MDDTTELPDAAVPPRDPRLRLTPDGRLRSGRLAGLPINRAIWVVAWPVLIDSLLSSLVGLTDTVLAAAISEPATDAVGSASYILWFIGLSFVALDIGATALIARAVGGRRMAVANAGVGQTFLLALASGVVLTLLVALCVPLLASTMGLKGEAGDDFRVYLYIIALNIPFMALLLAGVACLRGAGDTLRPLRAMILVNLVNITLSWALSGVELTTTTFVAGQPVTRTILHNPFPFDMGVAGIALGTAIAHAAGMVLVIAALVRGSHGVRLRKHRLKAHWHTMRRIARVGLPNFFEMLGMWFGNFLVILMVGWLGAGIVGAHMVAIRIESFSFQPGFAMGVAAATLAGQYLGAGSPELARRAVLRCLLVAVAIMGAMGMVFIFAPHSIVGLLTSQQTHLEQVPSALFVAGLVQVPFCIGIVLRQAMRGAGDVRVVMVITWVATYALRLPLVYVCSGVAVPLPDCAGGGVLANPFAPYLPWPPGLMGLWVGLSIEVALRGVLFAARFLQGGWTRARV
ncbi:MAG: MATE family efflux transporter [Phycisphaerales bacterium]